MAELDRMEKKFKQRSAQVEQSEKVMQERQEQLFKAYDTLTEKIFLFERECDSLRTRKRQLISLEARVQSTVKE